MPGWRATDVAVPYRRTSPGRVSLSVRTGVGKRHFLYRGTPHGYLLIPMEAGESSTRLTALQSGSLQEGCLSPHRILQQSLVFSLMEALSPLSRHTFYMPSYYRVKAFFMAALWVMPRRNALVAIVASATNYKNSITF